jgi:hypothetical protein
MVMAVVRLQEGYVIIQRAPPIHIAQAQRSAGNAVVPKTLAIVTVPSCRNRIHTEHGTIKQGISNCSTTSVVKKG